MDEQLKQLVHQVQQSSHGTRERQNALRELVDEMLRSRQICRPPRGQALSGIYFDIFQAVQQQLQQNVEQTIDDYNPQRTPVREWANGLRDGVFKQVLNSERLTQLALQAQRHNPRTPEWQYALQELLNAIRRSGKLSHQYQSAADIYEDAVTRTLFWVCQNINTYNPSKGKFMAWVNYRLDMMLREIQQDVKDPFVQSIEGKIIRKKYQLTALIRKTKEADFKSWLTLKLKGLIPDSGLSLQVIFILAVLLVLSQLISQKPMLGNSLVFEMSKQFLSLSSRLYEFADESKTLEDIAQPEEKPFLSETLRQYIEDDPAKLFQKHIREHPQATFQAIALGRLDGKTWKEMSESFGIGIPALNNFFQRNLRELAPEIRRYVQEQFD
jgi:methionine salvage enolase-phosphatase E1